jgi:UDP-N-acetyl-D-galactosamine dehydrogenase
MEFPAVQAHRAQELGHDPEIILAGRRLNDGMGDFIAGRIDGLLAGPSKVLLLGLTFKEDVPDLRNSRVVDVIEGLKKRGHQVVVHDPIADREEAQAEYDLWLADTIEGESPYDAVVGAVSHRQYRDMAPEGLCRLLKDGGLVADIKGMWRGLDLPAQVRRWSL